MKFRILELSDGFYPQEKECFIFGWEYIEKSGRTTLTHISHWSVVSTYEEAIEVIKKRKEYLNKREYKKIHNL